MSYQNGDTMMLFTEILGDGCVDNPGAMNLFRQSGTRGESKSAQDLIHTAWRSLFQAGGRGEHTPAQENPSGDLYTVWRLSNAGWHLTYMNTVPYITENETTRIHVIDGFSLDTFKIKGGDHKTVAQLLRFIRKRIRSDENENLYAFDDQNNIISGTSKVNHHSDIFVLGENRFGGDEKSKKTKFKVEKVSLLAGNINGLNTQKSVALKNFIGSNDKVLCFSETNMKEDSASVLANKLGCPKALACTKSLDFIKFNNRGERIRLLGTRKKSGYGTCFVSMAKNSKIVHKSIDFEIIGGEFSVGELTILCFSVYRSPSERDKIFIERFYEEIGSAAEKLTAGNLEKYAAIVVIGDDNNDPVYQSRSQSSTLHDAQQRLARRLSLVSLLGSKITNPKSGTQPDSCLVCYDPLKIKLSVNVFKPFMFGQDHCMMNLTFESITRVPVKLKYRTVCREVPRRVNIKSSKVFEEEFADFIDEYRTYLGWSKDGYPHAAHWKKLIPDSMVEFASNKFFECFNNAKKRLFEKKYFRVPDTVSKHASAAEVLVAQQRGLVESILLKIKDDPSEQNFILLQAAEEELSEVTVRLANSQLEKDLNFQRELYDCHTDRFWDITGALVNKDSYKTITKIERSEAEKLEVLDELDQHSTISYATPQNLDSYKDLDPSDIGAFEINTDELYIADMIRDTTKIDRLVKNHATEFAPALSVLSELMYRAQHFPASLKKSKCTHLPDRVIFSLSAIPKIIEKIFKEGLDKSKTDDGSYQMAYTADRGVVLNNAVTLQRVERAKEPVFQALKDLKKAFYTSNAETCIREAEKKFGAGKLVKSWFQNRRYFYKHIERGQGHNAGVPAGTLLGVENFLLFMATNESVSGKNGDLLIISLYADDASPGTVLSKIPQFQEALDVAKKWADSQGVSYHMGGKKGPQFLAYLKKGQKYPVEFDHVKLGDVLFQPAKIDVLGENGEVIAANSTGLNECDANYFSACLLGLLIKTRGKATKGTDFMNKFGYELEWPVARVKSIAYRIQDVQNDIIPERRNLMVNAYPAGVMRFCCCLKWLRAPSFQRDQLRFYYAMAIAATLGLNAAEIFNLKICASASVSENSEMYKFLIRDTGFPSLLEMVKMDAYSLILQWVKLEPWMFPEPVLGATSRKLAARRKKKMILPILTAEDGLVREVLDLALELEDERWVKAEDLKKRKVTFKNRPHLIDPAPPAVTRLAALRKDHRIQGWTNVMFQRMLRFRSLLVYNCFEPIDRLQHFKEPVQFTEVQTSEGEWIVKTFKRKRDDIDQISREAVTPVRIPLKNKFAYLEGREETFLQGPDFANTLTPVAADSESLLCSTPKRQKRSKYKRKKSPKNAQRPGKRKRHNNNDTQVTDSQAVSDMTASPLSQKRRVTGFKRGTTFKYFALVCNHCQCDISNEKLHILNCPKIKSDIKATIINTKSKDAIQKLYDIGAAIDTFD